MQADLTRLRNQDMSREDKDRLAAWMELTNQIGKMVAVASAQCNQDVVLTLGASNPLATATGSSGDGDVLTRKVI